MFDILSKFFDIAFKVCLGILGLFGLLLLLMMISPKPVDKPFIERAQQAGADEQTAQSELPATWPPKLDEPFPDLTLIDQNGASFRLSALKGKVLLIQFVNMRDRVSQAFSGSNEVGSYGGLEIEPGVKVFWKLLLEHAKGVKFPHPDMRVVQILLYDETMTRPKLDDVEKWAQHFRLYPKDGHIVATSPHDLRSKESFELTPGFMVVDSNFIVRGDATGLPPRQNLYTSVLPLLANLLKGGGVVTSLDEPLPLYENTPPIETTHDEPSAQEENPQDGDNSPPPEIIEEITPAESLPEAVHE